MRAQWIGGPQDGAWVDVKGGTPWVTVLEDRRDPGYVHDPASTDPPPRALMRYVVPVIDGRIVWAQRKQADHQEDTP